MIISNSYIQVVALQKKIASNNILLEYADYTNMFLFNLVLELPKNLEINEYVIQPKKLNSHLMGQFIVQSQ